MSTVGCVWRRVSFVTTAVGGAPDAGKGQVLKLLLPLKQVSENRSLLQ